MAREDGLTSTTAHTAPHTTSTAKRWTLVATIVASSMTFIDGTVINVALPALQHGMNATIAQVQWVIEAYALFLGSLLLVGGSLGDQIGRKRVFMIGVAIFTLASAACGLAPTPLFLISARAIQGIGAAFLVPGSLSIISSTFEGAKRGRAIGTWSGFSAITTAAGPVAGGWLVEHASWRTVFFINVPLAALVMFLSVRYVPESKDPSRGRSIDWAGALLGVVGLSGIVLGLLEWPSRGAGDRLVLLSLASGVVFLAALIVVEARTSDPMLPLAPFRVRAFTLSNLLTLFLYAALAEVMFMMPLLLIEVRGFSATAAGASLLPFPIIMFALSRWSGGLVARVGSKLPLTIGPAVTGAGFALLAMLGRLGSSSVLVVPAVVIMGLGMALTVAPLTTTVMSSLPSMHSGVASGVNNAVSRVAGLIAIAAFGVVIASVFNNRVTARLASVSMSQTERATLGRELPKMAAANVKGIASMSGDARRAVRRAIDDSFGGAFQIAMLGSAALAFAAALVGVMIPSRARG
ncbi:MAG TPA: MFS transporter [Gemmatimonadaceae bacterium]|nr:MFS transporter [Gemmatimonadaceae bacterium]